MEASSGIKDLSISDFSYNLPDEKIAHQPLPERDQSKLLVFRDGKINEDRYRNIASYLPDDSLMVFNNSRVIEARIVFTKESGAKIEVFCLEPHEQSQDLHSALAETGEVKWICLIGGASKWKHGQVLRKSFTHNGKDYTLQASWLEKRMEAFVIGLSWDAPELSFVEVLHLTGFTPLPPYIKRAAEASDADRYQTVYANESGSVAAPTAGLHFTEQVLSSLNARNIATEFLTLHVGAGTFKPVKAETMAGHDMHAEFIEVSLDSLQNISAFPGRHITAVGTTSMRTLESLYWMGVKVKKDPHCDPSEIAVTQWYAFENGSVELSSSEALSALLNWMRQQGFSKLITKTQLLIGPGYKFRMADALVTNFHQPKSTLLLLVAAMAGPGWKKIYEHALENDYRFLSYGDGCLIYKL